MTRFQIVDVFALRPRTGNQLAVVLDAASLDAGALQEIAREFDFSETTFVFGESEGAHRVRIFTSDEELPFAGHPTLGTAWVLRRLQGGDAVELDLDVGRIPVRFEREDGEELGWLTPPAVRLGAERDVADAAALLSLEPGRIDPAFPVQEATAGIPFLMVPVADLEALRAVRLDLGVRRRLSEKGLLVSQVYAFCRGSYTGGSELAVRMLFEAAGPREDPATGSAASALGGYALAHGFAATDRLDVRVEQGFEVGRPSLLRVRGRRGEGGVELEVGGACFPFAEGALA